MKVTIQLPKMLATFSLALCVLCGTATCQYAAVFSSYHAGSRYDFRIGYDELAKTPFWQDDDPNPPLSVRRAKLVGSEYLEQLFADADKWTINEITLRPVRDRWVYMISFTEPPPPNSRDCMTFPFHVVVTMAGVAVPATVSAWKPSVPSPTSD